MIHADPDPIAMELADLSRQLRPWLPRYEPDTEADLAALDEELARIDRGMDRFGLGGLFEPLGSRKPEPNPRDIHAVLWAWLFGVTLATTAGGLALGFVIRWALGLPILGPD